MHLTDSAATALQMGRVDQALRIYRQLERQEGQNPTWSLRVAECYRRLAQRDGEVSALMRAASRYENRGFVREALALWKRVQMVEPHHPSSRVALERLEPSRGLGLERFRSSFPPSFPSTSNVDPAAQREPDPLLPPIPTIPAAPRLPKIDEGSKSGNTEFDVAVTGGAPASDEADLEVPQAPAQSAIPLVRINVPIEPDVRVDEAPESLPLLHVPVFEESSEADEVRTALKEQVPITMRAADLEVAQEAHRIAEELTASIAAYRVAADATPVPVAAPAPGDDAEPAPAAAEHEPAPPGPTGESEPPPAAAQSELEPRAVLITPVVPVVAARPPTLEVAPLAPLPIISVGAKEEAEVEFIEAEVHPCIQKIDSEW